MGTTYYYEEDGMMIGESTDGVMRNYITDALGSVVGTALNGVAENTYKFTPYGGILDRTGTSTDPSFLWNGGSGYRATKLPNADYYVRRRIISTASGQWTTVDLTWPRELAYVYVRGRPVGIVDPSGLSSEAEGCCYAVDDLSINTKNSSDWVTVNGTKPTYCGVTGDRVGNFFRVHYQVSPVQTNVANSNVPTLEWWECSNQILDTKACPGGETTGAWHKCDLSQSKCQDDFKSLNFNCKDNLYGFIADAPTWPRSQIVSAGQQMVTKLQSNRQTVPPIIAVRNLYIYIRMTGSGTGCSWCRDLEIIQQLQYVTANGTATSFIQLGWPTTGTPPACLTKPVASPTCKS